MSPVDAMGSSLTLPSEQAVCVEAGMIALREGSAVIGHEHYISGILEVQVRSFNPRAKSRRPAELTLSPHVVASHCLQSKKKNDQVSLLKESSLYCTTGN